MLYQGHVSVFTLFTSYGALSYRDNMQVDQGQTSALENGDWALTLGSCSVHPRVELFSLLAYLAVSSPGLTHPPREPFLETDMDIIQIVDILTSPHRTSGSDLV